MQFLSGGLVVAVVIALGLVVALAILASPLFAAAIFAVAFVAFLVWRGSRRAPQQRAAGRGGRVPTTEEASADPEAPPLGPRRD